MKDLAGVATAPDEAETLRAEAARWQIEAVRQRNRADRLARIVDAIPANPIPPGETPSGAAPSFLRWMETVAGHYGFEPIMEALAFLWRRLDPDGARTLGPAACLVRAARAEAEGARAPDWCCDPADRDAPHRWRALDAPAADLAPGEIREVATLYEGPALWLAAIPVCVDDRGAPAETEGRLFDTEAAARAALRRAEAEARP